ncbi:amidohydrolase family protein [candidate division KSB1 bacterium]|nr:amidohydrolase family protein [candidate division KSB1 bacterium]
MSQSYKTDLYRRIHEELSRIPIIDCHEHLQRERELPVGDDIHIGRFFAHYANCDLVSSGMPVEAMANVQTDPSLSPSDRLKLIEPFYRRSWNTAYCESLRIAIRDLYGIEDFAADSIENLTDAMKQRIKPGFTRKVFDRANIEFALQNPFGPHQIYNPDFEFECFICDMVDCFTGFPIKELERESDSDIQCLDDYLKVIDFYFERDASTASAFKVGRAYDRTLFWDDVPKSAVERTFNRLLAFNDRPDRKDIQALEDFILHYLCQKCGDYALRMKYHTGIQEGNGNFITNSRAALMANLFMKYPKTGFDIYHISYPYHEELITLAKNFPNVTIDFCWMWVINPAAGRRALSDMLDSVPANKLHGFGGDYIFVEGTYGHSVIARREIARVLCEKVAEGRFSEAYALQIGNMLLRENALENFNLKTRREAFRKRAGEKST